MDDIEIDINEAGFETIDFNKNIKLLKKMHKLYAKLEKEQIKKYGIR